MYAVEAGKIDGKPEQELAAAPSTAVSTHGDRAFAAGDERHRRLERLAVLFDLPDERAIDLGDLRGLARDTVAQDDRRDAALAEELRCGFQGLLCGRDHAVLDAGKQPVARLR